MLKSGKLIEFPRKVEWEQIHGWVASVPGHPGITIHVIWKGSRYWWQVFIQGVPHDSGSDEDPDKAKDAALRSVERSVLVIRPLPQG